MGKTAGSEAEAKRAGVGVVLFFSSSFFDTCAARRVAGDEGGWLRLRLVATSCSLALVWVSRKHGCEV